MKKIIPEHAFRGYDMRGVVGEDFTEENVEILARAYATWLLRRRIYDCVVGRDCRLSSPAFRDAFVNGLTDSGITVYDIGMTMSQVAYFAQYYFRTRGMVMITASHNPKEYNGFKFGTGYSETMVTEEIHEFKQLVWSGEYMSLKEKGKVIEKDVFEMYAEDVIKKAKNIKPMKVVVDASAGNAGPIIPEILRRLGCEVIEQNTTPDGNFPVGTPDPTEREVQERLAARVKQEGADLGFSFDCDGDRLGVVDHEGNLMWNDTLVSIYAKDILEYLPGAKIVYNVLCSKQVGDVIQASGGQSVMWMTGHSFIKAKIKEIGAIFGGELSGHFFFVDNFFGHDDTAIGALRLLEYLGRKEMTLKEVVAELPQYISSPEIKVGCPDDIKFQVVKEQIAKKVKDLYPNAKYTEIDGIRMDTENEMLIFRASQNGPYMTIKFEAKTEEQYNDLKKQASDILHSIEEIDFTYGVNVEALL
ncbi:MAG: phosphomannomutase [Candidatus Magasanikbacteria bacterium CG11_big_fil_rev_8_21_14_0_20_39_34]|uniref:Phosphomannomutase n=1 Tax=Candidatus Magasanikbacteria bacterium CG11_big_fil_rev_8_21_14_0_20_39_34 TaxID=1974653 RepID=A0A2H0N4L8_9BACT|nr:MAG: phosphomannomutase [Candidatus Magasanikbacteria bacterium CG11_big_fil_rev_8_21_14_0_20_39_34]